MRLSSTRQRRYRYDYYRIQLPSDLVNTNDQDWAEIMAYHAIYQAEHQSKIWCTPCNWEAHLIEGGKDSFECVFKVRRKRFISQETNI